MDVDRDLVAGRRHAPSQLGAVLVLGLGKSGRSVVRYCADLIGTRVERMFVAAGERSDEAQRFLGSLERDGLSWAYGDEALEEAEGPFDLCIASPGIPFWHELYVRGAALSRQLMSEIEFAWRESAEDSVWVAISGTNGKTTTTSLAAHVLESCGMQARAVGNIGDVCLDAVAAGRTRVYVAEVSSYQLASTISFSPDVAVLLNVTPDHVHWHRSFEAYAQAKFKMLDNLASDGVAVLDATNDVVRAKIRELRAEGGRRRGFDYVPIGTAEGVKGDMRARCGAENAAFLDSEGVICIAYAGATHRILPASDLQIKGLHNAANALAAAAVGVVLGVDDASIASSLASFAPLEHRIEPCGSIGGVECFNDSKATNVDASVKALEAFGGRRTVVLLGGQDKGTDLSELVDAVFTHARGAVCFGEGGPRIADALERAALWAQEGFSLRRAEHLADALDEALAIAHPGEVILLSPACASFDEFDSFEQRGRVFKQLVSSRARG